MDSLNPWYEVKDGDPRAVAIFHRHYSCKNDKADHVRYGFSGKGASMVLLTQDCKALWCWRQVAGEGIQCSVFRNEGDMLSSDLIKYAVEMARTRWPYSRLYTYVDPKAVHGDGKCYKVAGWKKLPKRTKVHHLIELELGGF